MKHAPAETRHILRDRFARYLPVTQSGPLRPNTGDLLNDELLLKLLLNLRVVFESEADRARAAYETVLSDNSSEPSFNQAMAEGWFRIVWGRATGSRSPPPRFPVVAQLKEHGDPPVTMATLFFSDMTNLSISDVGSLRSPQVERWVIQFAAGVVHVVGYLIERRHDA
jgi:hypothetical protein